MGHEAWGWEGYVDARWSLRRRAAFNGSQGLLCCVSHVLGFWLCDVGECFFSLYLGVFVVFSVVVDCMVMSFFDHGDNSPVITYRRCIFDGWFASNEMKHIPYKKGALRTSFSTVGLRAFDCKGGLGSCLGILQKARLASIIVCSSTHHVDVEYKVWCYKKFLG